MTKGQTNMTQEMDERVRFMFGFIAKTLGAETLKGLQRRIGVDPASQQGTNVSVIQQANLLREACKAAGDVTFAAQMGQAMHEAHTLAGYIAQSSPTLRDAFKNAARFYKLTDASLTLELVKDGENEAMVIQSNDGALLRYHRHQEFLCFALLTRLRALAQTKFYPQKICFRHESGGTPHNYERLAGCSVQFGAAFTGLVFSEATLNTPFLGHDPELVAYLSQLGSEQLVRQGHGPRDIIARTERTVIRYLPGYLPGADEVAEELGMSRRTLARQLKEKGTSFRELTEQIRYDIAKTYLRDGLGISEIAYYLGYADHAAFSTAFRRWSGQSPRDYRKSMST